jgi:hypothetical protein
METFPAPEVTEVQHQGAIARAAFSRENMQRIEAQRPGLTPHLICMLADAGISRNALDVGAR